MDEYQLKRDILISKASADHFSNSIKLHKRELDAEKKLFALREKMFE